MHEYPNDAGFPSVIISSGVATRECLKPVSSNLPPSVWGALAAAEAKVDCGLSTDDGDTMLSFLMLLLGWYALSADEVCLCVLHDGATMLSLTASADDEGFRCMKVGWGQTRLISTLEAEEILRSVHRGGEAMLILVRFRLALVASS